MNNGYGALILLFLGIGFIFVATTAKGKAILGLLFGGDVAPTETTKQSENKTNNTDNKLKPPSDVWVDPKTRDEARLKLGIYTK